MNNEIASKTEMIHWFIGAACTPQIPVEDVEQYRLAALKELDAVNTRLLNQRTVDVWGASGPELYSAYRSAFGDGCPAWDALSVDVRDRWQATAEAALNAVTASETREAGE